VDHPDRPPDHQPPPWQRRLGRRSVLAGLGVAGVTAAAAGAGILAATQDDPPSPTPTGTSAPAANQPVPTAPPGTPAPPPAARATGPTLIRQSATGLPEGMALVTSPRVPIFGVGGADVAAMLGGTVADWRDLGVPFGLAVEPLEMDGVATEGGQPVATVPDYEALVAALGERPGGIALIPLEQVDFRVNVLAVDGFDPLRDTPDDTGEAPLRIGAVGDIVPGRNVHYKMLEYGDFTRPFLRVKDTLAAFDLTFANLEGNVSSTLPQPADANAHTFTFLSDPAMLDGLKLAGIDAVSLANNHSHWSSQDVDWGAQGLLDTLAALEAAALPFYGAGRTLDEARRVWSTDAKGRSIALLGVDGVTANLDYPEMSLDTGVVGPYWGAGPDTAGTNPFALGQVVDDVAAAAAQHDIVIPYLHMGAEYRWVVPQWVVEAAHAAIDAGAAMVVTNHPHIIQGMEVYAGKPIVYSIGNFVFDQMFSVDTRQGLILDLTFRGSQVVGLRTHGVEIEDFHQPRLMTGAEQAAIMDRFWRSTDRLAGR